MGEDKKWKSRLLSSSLPLEYDAAKLLVTKGFSVTSDYTYSRNDLGVLKDFSVDIEATAYAPFDDPNNISATLMLLVECKYRNNDIKWMFLPDVNDDDYSPITLGNTVRVVDEFSFAVLDDEKSEQFDLNNSICYKGVEINFTNSNVYDSEIKHGISQLQYALPRLLKETMLFELCNLAEDNSPFFFCPILLTTAELLVAENDFDISKVEDASNIYDISHKVPYLVCYSDFGPDFEAHCINTLGELHKLKSLSLTEKIEKRRQASRTGKYETKISIVGEDLANGLSFELHKYFTQFIICNYDEFSSLLDVIKNIVSDIISNAEVLLTNDDCV